MMTSLLLEIPRTAQFGKLFLRILLCLILLLGLSFFAYKLVVITHEESARAEFMTVALENEKALFHRLASYGQALLGAEGFIHGSGEVTRQEWLNYEKAIDVRTNLPGINGIGYVAEVRPEEMGPFLERIRKDGARNFLVQPETDGDQYFIVIYVAPLQGNERVLGLNLAFEANRMEVATNARDSGKPVISRRIPLVQDQTKSPGFLLLHPVYRNDMPIDTRENRRAAFRGWIYASFVGSNLLRDLTQSQGRTVNLKVFDGTAETPDGLIYSSDDRKSIAAAPRFTVRKQLQVMQQTWTLVWTSTAAFETAQNSSEALLVLVGGLIFTGGISLFVLTFARRAATVERLVVEKTREIAANEKQLKLLISHTPAAVAMFDRQMRYIMMSERWLHDYGLHSDEILGRTHYEIFPEILANETWLSAHRRVLSGESLSKEEDSWQRQDGRTEWVKWALHPWTDGEGRIGGMVMFTEVITQRKEGERRAELIRELAIESAVAQSVHDVLDLALTKMCRYLRWPLGHAYSWGAEKAFHDATQIWHAESASLPQPESHWISEAVAFALKHRLAGRVVSQAKAAFVETPPERPSAWTDQPQLRSGLGIPVFVNLRVVAVLEFFTPEAVAEDPTLLGLCELVSVQLSGAIERKEAEAALKDSEERYERAVQGSSVGLWEWDIRSGKLYWSPRFIEMVGMSPHSSRPNTQDFKRRLHPEDRRKVITSLNAHLKRRVPFDIQYRLMYDDGAYLWIHSRGQATWDETGRPKMMAGSADDVTERNRIEHALAKSNQLNTAILASTRSLVIATDEKGKVILFNKAAEVALGYPADDVVGRQMPAIYDEEELARRAEALNREYVQPVKPGFDVLVHKARLYGAESYQWTFIRRNGARFPVHLTMTPLLSAENKISGFLSVVDDITERLAQQEALSERELRLRNIIDKAVDGLIVIDESGMIETFNPACERMFGYQASDVIGSNVMMLMPEPFHDGHGAAMRGHRENPGSRLAEIVHELEGKRRDGSIFPIDLSISNVSLPGRRIFSGIIRDISQRKETELKLLAYAAELERSNRELDEFAYVASHDLKAPLRVINNASRWLEEDLAAHLSQEDKMNMDMLRNRVQRMEKLLDDLLEYSRVGRASDDRFAEVVNGRVLMDDIVLLLSPPPAFEVRVLPGFDGIEVNRMPLQQVIYNLIGNAIKHHDKKAGLIEVGVEDTGALLRFTVRDDGPGIPERFHEQVFKMFQTLKPRDQVEGSGMGLAFVRKTVGYFGGEISLVSAEGEGATFSFTWPKQQKTVGEVQWKAA